VIIRGARGGNKIIYPAAIKIPPARARGGRETLKEKLKPWLQTGEWAE
jgi:hypothetical protein